MIRLLTNQAVQNVPEGVMYVSQFKKYYSRLRYKTRHIQVS